MASPSPRCVPVSRRSRGKAVVRRSDVRSGVVMVRLFGVVDAVDDDGVSLRIGGPKERTVLARLAIEDSSWVSESRLVDALWPQDPPPSARRTLQKYLSRLRTALRGEVTLESRRSSHRLVVDHQT